MTRPPPVLGAGLIFAAGVAAGQGALTGGAVLAGLVVLLRPRPLVRQGPGRLLLPLLLVAAGVLHGARAPTDEGLKSSDGAGAFRDRARGAVTAHLDRVLPREAPLARALILADRSELEPGARQAFVRSGAAHLLAISGFHVGVLAGWVLLLLRALGLSRRGAAAGAAGVVWGYVALLGFPTSASRAGLLLTGAALGRLRGRPVHGLGAWATALLVVSLWWPSSVVRPGAQLSFAGALGLLRWAGPWTRAAEAAVARRTHRTPEELGRWEKAALAAICASCAAQVATLPLATWHFQRVSVLGLPATLAATPLVSLALPGVLLALAAGLPGAAGLPLPGAGVLGAGAEGLLWASRTVLVGFAALDPGWLLGPGAVVLATALGVATWRGSRRRVGVRRRVTLAGAAVVGGLLWSPQVERLAGGEGLEIRMLDVGQGDAVALRTPAGRWLLVDTGMGSGERLARTLVAGGISRLELLVLTHPDLDHMGAAAGLVAALPVSAVADGGTIRGTEAFRTLVRAVDERGIPWVALDAGTTWTLDGVTLQVLHPARPPLFTEPNDRSVVLRVSWGEFDLLLTGDISVEVEAALAARLAPVEVLKVAHHGSRTSTGPDFLDRVQPEAALISVGRGNRFGHPAPEVVARLRERGVRLFRTDRDGTVRILADRTGTWRSAD